MDSCGTHTQQFALKWNNFHTNLSSGFHELFEAAEMVDVTLAVDGKFLQAHKVVLSICSPYFKEMFKVNPCKHPIVILNNVRHEHMKDILEFVYLGGVSVLRENLTSFLRTAELLQVKGLTGDDPSETSSKDGECDNIEEGEYTAMLQSLQYNQQYHSIPQHFPIPNQIVRPPSPPPIPAPPPTQQMPNMNIPHIANNKRPPKNPNGGGANGKRTKIDNNANQSISSKHTLTPSMKMDEFISPIRKNQEAEPEYTDISNMKSERSLLDEEILEKHIVEKSAGGYDTFVDQGKPEKYGVKPTYPCEKCPKKFTRRDHLKTHEKNIHGEDAGPFACIVCAQLYKNTESLRKHISKFHISIQAESVAVNLAKA